MSDEPKDPSRPGERYEAIPATVLAEDLGSVVWEADPETERFRFIGGRTQDVFGCTSADRRWEPEFGSGRVHPEDRTRWLERLRTPSETAAIVEYRATADDGSERFLRDVFRYRFDRRGRPAAIFGTTSDVSERRDLEVALRNAEQRYRLLFEGSLAGVFRMTAEGALLDCNDGFAKLFGFASREAALDPSSRAYFSASDLEKIDESLTRTGTVANAEIQIRRGDGKPMWVLGSFTTVGGASPPAFDGALVDITGRKKAEVLIEYQAYHDGLTGLANRKLFRDRLEHALAQARRKKRGLAVLFFDVDHFKLVNDRLGHDAGDRLLQEIGLRLTRTVRKVDTVARLGGDEFTLLLLDTESAEGAVRVGRKLLEAMGPPFTLDGRSVSASASVGISLFPGDGDDEETLVKCADAAMYRAKELGRNNCQLYTRALQVRAMRRLTVEADLKEALAADRLEVHFQPQVHVEDGEIRGFEALLRWPGPDGRMIPPAEFIPIAEESSLILEIGEWVLKESCRWAREWHAAGFPRVTVAVNLSPRQIQSGGTLELVQRTLREARMPAELLELEVTESVAMQDVEQTRMLFSTLRGLGVRIAIDDFGTGHSSLSYVKHLPVHTLKIDQSFVRDIPGSMTDEAIIGAIVHMAAALRLRVLAEGVETIAQRDLLIRKHCGEMQGFFFSRALPPEGALRLLRETSPTNWISARPEFG